MSVYYGPRNGKRRARRRRHRRARSVSHFWEFFDPSGSRHGGLPTYPWGMAPEGLATKRQLLALELRPGGQPIAAQIMWIRRGKPVFAYLYRVDRAKPKRIPTLAQLHAIEKALQARRTCPVCGLDAGYTIPTSLGCCVDCYNRLKRRSRMREAEIQGIGRLRLLLCDIVWLEVLTCDVIDATVSEKR